MPADHGQGNPNTAAEEAMELISTREAVLFSCVDSHIGRLIWEQKQKRDT